MVLDADDAHGGVKNIWCARCRYAPGVEISPENGDCGRTLVADEEPLLGRIQCEIAWRGPTAETLLEWREGAVVLADGEGGDRVGASVGDVKETSRTLDVNSSGHVRACKVGRRGGKVLSASKNTLLGVPGENVDGGEKFVDRVRPRTPRMEGKASRTGARDGLIERCLSRLQLCSAWVEAKGSNVIQTEIVDYEEAVIVRERGAVRIGC